MQRPFLLYLFLICESCFKELDKQILRPPVIVWKTGGHFLSGKARVRSAVCGATQENKRTNHTEFDAQFFFGSYSPGPS